MNMDPIENAIDDVMKGDGDDDTTLLKEMVKAKNSYAQLKIGHGSKNSSPPLPSLFLVLFRNNSRIVLLPSASEENQCYQLMNKSSPNYRVTRVWKISSKRRMLLEVVVAAATSSVVGCSLHFYTPTPENWCLSLL